MLATLLLQLSPVDLLDDGQAQSAALLPDAGEQAKSGFAQLLRLRVDASPIPEPASSELPVAEGGPLPAGGKFLPPVELLPQGLPRVEQPLGEDVAQGDNLSSAAHVPVSTMRQSEPLPVPLPVLPITPPARPAGMEQSPAPRQMPVDGIERRIERPIVRPDISLNSRVVYPASPKLPTEQPHSIEPQLPRQPVAPLVRIDKRAAALPVSDRDALARLESRADTTATPAVTRTELAARTQDIFTTSERIETAAPTKVGLREHGQPLSAATRILPDVLVAREGAIDEERLHREASRLAEQLQPQRIESARDTGIDRVRQRAVVQQPTATPQAQAATQPSQVAPTVATIATTAGDLDVSTTNRQAPDLINTPVRDSAWGERIGERVLVMAGKNLQAAEIRLTPAELGPLRVRVSVDDGAANVTFHAQHAVTREALEQAMPRLREMLAESGLTLGQADVAEQGIAGRDRDSAAGRPIQQGADESDDSGIHENEDSEPRRDKHDGLVDTFA